jgi:tripartite ATP-independent transporter DctM subunit
MLVTLLHARRHGYPREVIAREVILPRTLAALPGLFALAIVLGGILGGVCTPAEVGTILLTYVLLLSVLFYHSAPPRLLYRTTIKAGYTSGMTLFLVSCSCFFGFVVARDMLSILVVDVLSHLNAGKYLMIFILQMVFLVLGMVLEAAPIIFGFMPTFMPLIALSAIDPVHWGVLFVVNMGLGMIVPPIALNLFISTQIAEVRYGEAVRASIPFMVIMAANIAIVAIFPKIALIGPHLLFGYPMK